MGPMIRLVRLCRANIHGLMDRFENKSFLLKQHLREMEEALSRKDVALKRLQIVKEHREKRLARTHQETAALQKDLSIAFDGARDDMARFIIGKLKTLDPQKQALERDIHELERETGEIAQCLLKQRLEYERLKHRSMVYLNRAGRETWQRTAPKRTGLAFDPDVSDEEVEIELLRLKERTIKEVL